MREIKFRVWNGKEMDFFTLDNCFDCHAGWLEGCVLTQSTGLKDTKGNDVYEGDVIKQGDNIDYVGYYKGLCEQSHGGGSVVGYGFGRCWDEDTIEVLGNIHENPDWRTKWN